MEPRQGFGERESLWEVKSHCWWRVGSGKACQALLAEWDGGQNGALRLRLEVPEKSQTGARETSRALGAVGHAR